MQNDSFGFYLFSDNVSTAVKISSIKASLLAAYFSFVYRAFATSKFNGKKCKFHSNKTQVGAASSSKWRRTVQTLHASEYRGWVTE